MVEKITQALVAAYKKDKRRLYRQRLRRGLKDDDMHMYVQKEVVDDVITPATEITLDAARKIEQDRRSWATSSTSTCRRRTSAASPRRRPSRSSSRASAKQSAAWSSTPSRPRSMRFSPARCCASSLHTSDMTIRIGGGNDQTDAMLSASEQVHGEVLPRGRPHPRLCRGGPPLDQRPAGHRLPDASGPGQAAV